MAWRVLSLCVFRSRTDLTECCQTGNVAASSSAVLTLQAGNTEKNLHIYGQKVAAGTSTAVESAISAVLHSDAFWLTKF